MKLLISKAANINYLAKIVKIDSFFPHPNADKLKCCNVDGNKIIVDKTYEEGLYVYIPLECVIDEKVLKYNNLYRDKTLNENTEESGFFEKHGRVKCIKLRNMISEGIILPLSSLNVYGDIEFIKDTEFDSVGENIFVKKYQIKKLREKHPGLGGKNTKSNIVDIIEDKQFNFHQDTAMLYKNLHEIDPNSFIQNTVKKHGTSGISSKILCKRKLSLIERLLLKCGVKINTLEYREIWSSRKVIKNPEINSGQGYYNFDIWTAAHSIISPYLINGMTMYYEIVGYLPTGQMIQKKYDYGCIYNDKLNYSEMTPREMYDNKLFNIYVYRITTTNNKGQVIEFSTQQVQQYCNQNNILPVIQLYYGKARNLFPYVPVNGEWRTIFLEELKNKYLEKNCEYCLNKVPDEGIVLRVDDFKLKAFKLKSNLFYLNETVELDNGTVDIESEQSESE